MAIPGCSPSAGGVSWMRRFAPPLLPEWVTRLKNAAVAQKSSCVHRANGWSWHSAHFISTPSNNCETVPVITPGCGAPRLSPWSVKKIVAEGKPDDLRKESDNAWVRQFFNRQASEN